MHLLILVVLITRGRLYMYFQLCRNSSQSKSDTPYFHSLPLSVCYKNVWHLNTEPLLNCCSFIEISLKLLLRNAASKQTDLSLSVCIKAILSVKVHIHVTVLIKMLLFFSMPIPSISPSRWLSSF